MSNYYEKLKKKAATWVLKSLYTNDLWFDESKEKKRSAKNHLFIPLFDIAMASKKFDLRTLKETCYLLQQNSHITIWGDDYDPRAMLVQISEEGVRAYKQSFYGYDYESIIKKSITAAAAVVMVAALTIGINKFVSYVRPQKNQSFTRNSYPSDLAKKSAASVKSVTK